MIIYEYDWRIAIIYDEFTDRFFSNAYDSEVGCESVRILINAMDAFAQDKEFNLPKKDIAFLHNQISSLCTDLVNFLLPPCTKNAIDNYRISVFREMSNEENLNYYDDYCRRVEHLRNSYYDFGLLTPFKSLTLSSIRGWKTENAVETFEFLKEFSILADHPIFDNYS